MSVVDRSTPDRSAPVRSVSLRMATPRSAPENWAPLTLARRKLVLRSRARLKLVWERSQRKNSMPLAWASSKLAPARLASVRSAFRKSVLRRLAPERSAELSRARRRSAPSRFAPRRMAPLRLTEPRSARLRLAPERSALAPPSLPEKKSSCAARISLTRLPLWVMLLVFLSPIEPDLAATKRAFFILPEAAGPGNRSTLTSRPGPMPSVAGQAGVRWRHGSDFRRAKLSSRGLGFAYRLGCGLACDFFAACSRARPGRRNRGHAGRRARDRAFHAREHRIYRDQRTDRRDGIGPAAGGFARQPPPWGPVRIVGVANSGRTEPDSIGQAADAYCQSGSEVCRQLQWRRRAGLGDHRCGVS